MTNTAASSDFFSPEDIDLIRRTICPQASDVEFRTLIRVASIRRLNPLLGQIHFVKRSSWDPETQTKEERWAFQVGISGFRLIAQRTGQWDGEGKPTFEETTKGDIYKCTVEVFRKDISRSFVGEAYFSEFAQTKRNGGLTKMWAEKPRLMIAKCATAAAYRMAFPEETSGLTEEAEWGKLDRESEGDTPRVGASLGAATPAHNEVTGEVVSPPTTAPPQLAQKSAQLAAAFLREMDERESDFFTKEARDAFTGRIGTEYKAGHILDEDRDALLRAWNDKVKKLRARAGNAS